MPLPPALQARLLKRGLIKDEEKEEKKEEEEENEFGKGCPNVSNPYHTCVDYCVTRWGAKKDDKENEIKTVPEKPLPPGWFKVPDPQSGHSYFWNVHTNQVSWLHPNDPKANVSMPAAWIQAQQLQKEKEIQPTPPGEEESNQEEPESKEIEKEKGKKKDPPKIKTGKHPSLIKAQKHKERYGKRKKEHRDELDPMDPASYADVPRGNWSSGLKDEGDAKTGVDTTANGPLFQQRPYPSPGEVLRRNQKRKEAADEEDD